MHAPKVCYFTYNTIISEAFLGISEFSEFKQQVKSRRFTVFKVHALFKSMNLTYMGPITKLFQFWTYCADLIFQSFWYLLLVKYYFCPQEQVLEVLRHLPAITRLQESLRQRYSFSIDSRRATTTSVRHMLQQLPSGEYWSHVVTRTGSDILLWLWLYTGLKSC